MIRTLLLDSSGSVLSTVLADIIVSFSKLFRTRGKGITWDTATREGTERQPRIAAVGKQQLSGMYVKCDNMYDAIF